MLKQRDRLHDLWTIRQTLNPALYLIYIVRQQIVQQTKLYSQCINSIQNWQTSLSVGDVYFLTYKHKNNMPTYLLSGEVEVDLQNKYKKKRFNTQ